MEMTCFFKHGDGFFLLYDLWMAFLLYVWLVDSILYRYIFIYYCLQGIKEKQIKKKQTERFAVSLLTAKSLQSASWRQRGHVAAACAIWAVAVTIWSVLCRQSTQSWRQSFAVSRCTTPGKLLPCGPRQVLCRQPDGKLTVMHAVNSAHGVKSEAGRTRGFAVSLGKMADGKAVAVGRF